MASGRPRIRTVVASRDGVGLSGLPISATSSVRAETTSTAHSRTNAGRTSIWGDGTSGTSVYSRVNPPNNDVNVTIYGRVPAAQDVSVGSYSDTVSATINF